MSSGKKIQKLKFYSNEKWNTLRGFKGADGQQYAISNHGRVIAFWDTHNNGYFLRYSYIKNYPGIQLRKDRGSKGFLVHRLVAEHFCKKPGVAYKFVIHLDHDKENNYYRNLKWVTKAGKDAHMVKDPNYKRSKAEFSGKGHKLTVEQVKRLKKKIAAAKTQMNVLSKQFGISDMQLYRIKSGQNWGHVKI
ncbi:MAG: HNH endonuclease [Cyclobacteriaceae bacterium]|nr:HNH endonuclease [Cyclobacteriaceae bacterium]